MHPKGDVVEVDLRDDGFERFIRFDSGVPCVRVVKHRRSRAARPGSRWATGGPERLRRSKFHLDLRIGWKYELDLRSFDTQYPILQFIRQHPLTSVLRLPALPLTSPRQQL